MKYNKSVIAIFAFIMLLLLFHGWGNLKILNKSRFNLSGDAAFNYQESYKFFQQINVFTNNKDLIELFYGYTSLGGRYRPPMTMITASFFYFFFGFSEKTAILSNFLYFSILLFSTYGIGKNLYNYKIGILSAFLISMFPAIFGQSRVFLQDFPLAAMTALSFYLFLLTENFSNLKYSLLFGVSIGLGLLTKWSYPIFILPLLIYSLSKMSIGKNKLYLRNLLISLVSGLILASTWYIPNFSIIFTMLSKTALKVIANERWYYYIESLFQHQLLLPFFIFFLFTSISFVVKRKFFLSLLIIFPFLIFSLSTNKTSRFILPVFVPIAIMMAKLIESVDGCKLITPVIILFSLTQYFLVCFIPNDLFWLRAIKSITSQYPDSQQGFYTAVDRGDWKADEILQVITNDIKDKRSPIKVLVIPNVPNLLGPLKTFSILRKIPIDFVCPAEWDHSVEITRNNDFDSIVLNSDYVITKTGSQGYPWIEDYLNYTKESFIKHQEKFLSLKRLVLDEADGSVLAIYQQR